MRLFLDRRARRNVPIVKGRAGDDDMKGTLVFDLPGDRGELIAAMRGPTYHAALAEFNEFLRMGIKHGTIKSIDEIESQWRSCVEEIFLFDDDLELASEEHRRSKHGDTIQEK